MLFKKTFKASIRDGSVTIGSITAAQARRSGFADIDELLSTLRKSAKSRLTSRSKVFRVAFRHEKQVDPRIKRREVVSTSALDQVDARLDRMDRLSRRGPWTSNALRIISENPKVAAPQAPLKFPSLGPRRLVEPEPNGRSFPDPIGCRLATPTSSPPPLTSPRYQMRAGWRFERTVSRFSCNLTD